MEVIADAAATARVTGRAGEQLAAVGVEDAAHFDARPPPDYLVAQRANALTGVAPTEGGHIMAVGGGAAVGVE